MAFDLRTYFAITRQTLSGAFGRGSLGVHLPLLVGLPAAAAFNALCMRADDWIDPSLARQPIPAPVFVVGNARSGTTFFHHLLALDEASFVHFELWEVLLPARIQKQGARALASALRRGAGWLGVEGLLARLEGAAFGELDGLRALGLAKPEEDEFLLLSSFNTSAISAIFPSPELLARFEPFDARPCRERERVMDFYAGCVRRQLDFHRASARGATLLSKNPAFVTKLRTLDERFPDARYVYLVRDPLETLPSLISLLRKAWAQIGIEPARTAATEAAIVDGCVENYRYAAAFLAELPAERHAIVRYEALVADPLAAVEAVYERLGLPLSPDYRAQLEAARDRARTHRSAHSYDFDELGLDRAELLRRLEPAHELLRWSGS